MTEYHSLPLPELLKLEKTADEYMGNLRKQNTVKSRQLIALALKKQEHLKQAIGLKQALLDVEKGVGIYEN